MIRFTSVITALAWAVVLAFEIRLLTPTGSVSPSTVRFAVGAIVIASSAIFLAGFVALRRSYIAAWWLLIISIGAGIWSSFLAWQLILPVIRYPWMRGGTTLTGWSLLSEAVLLSVLPWLWAIVCYKLHRESASRPLALRIFGLAAFILLSTAAWILYRAQTDRWVVFETPVTLQTDATISHDFSVDRWTNYQLLVDCERTPDNEEDVEDALKDGLEARATIKANAEVVAANCSDPEHMRSSQGHLARVLCSFNARPGRTYSLALHVIRYGQGISSRDHKLAGTWDENLVIPDDAHSTLKIVVNPIDYESVGFSIFLLFGSGIICLVGFLLCASTRLFRRGRGASGAV